MKTFLYIVSAIGTLLWALAFFFGFNYYIGGSLMVSIPCAIFLALILGGSIYLMIIKSHEKEMLARNTERLALGVYVLFSLASCVFVGHFVDVSANKKDAIRTEALAQIDELRVTLGCAGDGWDSQTGSYREWVEKMKGTKAIGMTGEDEGTIRTDTAEVRAKLIDKEYINFEDEAISTLSYARHSVNTWDWFNAPRRLAELRKNKGDWEDHVRIQSQKDEFTRDNPYIPVSNHNNFEIFDELTTLNLGGCFGLWSILLIVVLQFMMIISYFIMRPDRASGARRYKGAAVGSLSDFPDDPADNYKGGGAGSFDSNDRGIG